MMEQKPKILLVEDEENLHATIKLNFELEGFDVVSAFDGAVAIQCINNEHFDVLVLDIMLPELDGISITEHVRLKNNDIPILILSAKNTSNDRITGLKKGADDYLTKPFSLEELILRVQNLIIKNDRIKNNIHLQQTFNFNGNAIDFKAQTATNFNQQKIELSQKEMMLLKLLIDNKNEVVNREKILQQVWGYDVFPTTRTIDNFILNFRKYFESDPKEPKHFISVRGVGYKFIFD